MNCLCKACSLVDFINGLINEGKTGSTVSSGIKHHSGSYLCNYIVYLLHYTCLSTLPAICFGLIHFFEKLEPEPEIYAECMQELRNHNRGPVRSSIRSQSRSRLTLADELMAHFSVRIKCWRYYTRFEAYACHHDLKRIGSCHQSCQITPVTGRCKAHM